jgi:hypothetical protein
MDAVANGNIPAILVNETQVSVVQYTTHRSAFDKCTQDHIYLCVF